MEDHKEKESGMRQKGKRQKRPRWWKVKDSFFGERGCPTNRALFPDLLDRRGGKTLWGKQRENARASCEVPKVSDSKAKWEEHLPPTDREQLETQKEAQAHPTGTSRKIAIFPHKHTNIHTLRTTIPAGYELQCSCCHGDTVSCWPPWLHFPAPWLLKEMIDKCPNVSRPIWPHRMGGWGVCVGFHSITIGKFVCVCVFINTHIHVYIHICVLKVFQGQQEEKQQLWQTAHVECTVYYTIYSAHAQQKWGWNTAPLHGNTMHEDCEE